MIITEVVHQKNKFLSETRGPIEFIHNDDDDVYTIEYLVRIYTGFSICFLLSDKLIDFIYYTYMINIFINFNIKAWPLMRKNCQCFFFIKFQFNSTRLSKTNLIPPSLTLLLSIYVWKCTIYL